MFGWWWGGGGWTEVQHLWDGQGLKEPLNFLKFFKNKKKLNL
jgi:hypothetical protein